MTDKNLTDNEIPDIKELLKYKAKVACQNCDLIGKGCCNTCINNLVEEFVELFDRLQAENERLKEEVHKGHIAFQKRGNFYRKEIKIVESEAYKEFAERLKKALYSDSCRLVFDSDLDIFECAVDNLLKELVGE